MGIPTCYVWHSPREEANVLAHEHAGMATSVECVGLMLDPPNQIVTSLVNNVTM